MVCHKLGRPVEKCCTRTKPLEDSGKEVIKVDNLDDQEFNMYCLDKINHSMAVHLTDLVLRRMNLATRGKLSPEKLDICVEMMSHHFGWSAERQQRELTGLNQTWLSPGLKQQLARLMSSSRIQ